MTYNCNRYKEKKDFLIDNSSLFTQVTYGNEHPLTDIYNGKCLHLFLIRKSLVIPPAIFQHYHPGTFISFAMQDPRRLFIFSLVLKPYKLERVFI